MSPKAKSQWTILPHGNTEAQESEPTVTFQLKLNEHAVEIRDMFAAHKYSRLIHELDNQLRSVARGKGAFEGISEEAQPSSEAAEALRDWIRAEAQELGFVFPFEV